jgi:hypothetical protein
MNSAKPPPKPAAGWKSPLGAGLAVAMVFFAFHVLYDHLHPPQNGQQGGQPGADSTSPPKVTPLPPLSSYTPTPRHEYLLRVFVGDVIAFSLLHEMGHMVFSQYNVPVGSTDTNESAADSFAAAIMTKKVVGGASPQHNPLVSVALFWDALYTLQQTSAPGQYDWADVHGQPEQRAIKLACLLYGANPEAFADIAAKFNLQHDRDACIADAVNNQKDWSSVISLNLDPDAGKLQVLDQFAPHVAVLYHQVPDGLPNGLSATLSHERQVVQDLGTLDLVGRNLLLLKTPPDSTVESGQWALEAKRNLAIRQDPLSVPLGDWSPFPHLDHPSDGDSLSAYNYTVVGDSCLNDNGEPNVNAYWEPNSKSIKLCYGLVAMAEALGKRLLAETH